MGYLLLVFKSAFRNRLRASLTGVGVAIAIVAFLFLRTLLSAWYAGAESAAADRMVVRNKISIIFPLPMAYTGKVQKIPGVTDVSWANWFGGTYIDERNFFAQFAVDPESYLRVVPEIVITPEAKKAWLDDRSGCIVGELLAEKYKWKVGDTIAMKGTIYPGDWKFTIRGIYKAGTKNFDVQTMFFHWKLLDEQMPEGRKSQLSILLIRVADPAQSVAVAQAIDKEFLNSPAETRTESEKQFQMAFVAMSGALLSAIEIISYVVLLILMIIIANTMAMSTRERTTEYAVLRAIGFKPAHVIGFVMGEGLIIGGLGAMVGVLLTAPLTSFIARALERSLGAFLGAFELDKTAAALAVLGAMLGAMLASVVPAWRAGRMRLVDALRRVE
ncbi:MAG: FtsX-like permease family protein [Myxococcales bacterium]|nr:FtsX-like permease family protein [Myxococcales bacterium]